MRITKKAIRDWFSGQGWRVLPFQEAVWTAYGKGQSGLIHSPTGTGKSLAAFLGAVLAHAGELASGSGDGRPARRKKVIETTSPAPPITVLWITPLRALALDTRHNLAQPIQDLGLNWTISSRTGDTSSAERARQKKRLPTVLITTPESLSLLLSYVDTARQLKHVRSVVVDEWHELMGSKRGVQLELCLARLRSMVPALRYWGLSATIGNIDEAARVLMGPNGKAEIVSGRIGKENRITGLIPADMRRFPWSGYMGLALLPEVIDAIDDAGSTLLFTNTRSQAERWFEALTKARLDWIGLLALHHGSLDSGLRKQVEDLLRRGELKCVVATSSLDLGVDFSPVERVIQVGSPKGVARLLQRAGRSGHQPGAVSEVLCAPTHAIELVEIAAARAASEAGRIEARAPLTLCLDVLVQHLVTLALAGGVNPDEVLPEARDTHAFAQLTDSMWQWVLDFVVRGGPALSRYPQYQRLITDGTLLKPATRRISNLHRMAIGTITAEASVRVQYRSGGYLGMVEESFISRMRPGDVFLFSGKHLELIRVREMTAQVKPAKKSRAAVPRWAGGRLPLSMELARALLEQFAAFDRGEANAPEMKAVAPLLAIQQRWSALPGPTTMLVERTRSRDGISLFFYPFAGRLVHEGMAALFAWRLSKHHPATFSFSMNDYGFELLSREEVPFDTASISALFDNRDPAADVLAAINASEMAKRQFRDIARIAGLIFQGYPGASKSTRQIQASSGLIYDVLVRHDPGNELPRQAEREVLEAQFEIGRLSAALESMQGKKLVLTEPARLTPMAFPLWADRLGSRLSTESWQERVEKMRLSLEKASNKR